ncbi:MAG: pyridoxamine 5'-phosphate oxidase family protein [Propionibacteriaceae bacterium]|nr:pyridoxamine 5'-phosphate oxidase family protein [Micropruina sp.]
MEDYGHAESLPPGECRQLLADSSVGRVCWPTPEGIQVLPVVYRFDGTVIVFRTSQGTRLAELLNPTAVAFQVDDLDMGTRVGWTVLVQGVTGPTSEDHDLAVPAAWVPGDRSLSIQITPHSCNGRAVAAAD